MATTQQVVILYLMGKCGLLALIFCFLLFAFWPPILTAVQLNPLTPAPLHIGLLPKLFPNTVPPNIVAVITSCQGGRQQAKVLLCVENNKRTSPLITSIQAFRFLSLNLTCN